jgi:hypothetical protein
MHLLCVRQTRTSRAHQRLLCPFMPHATLTALSAKNMASMNLVDAQKKLKALGDIRIWGWMWSEQSYGQ